MITTRMLSARVIATRVISPIMVMLSVGHGCAVRGGSAAGRGAGLCDPFPSGRLGRAGPGVNASMESSRHDVDAGGHAVVARPAPRPAALPSRTAHVVREARG